MSSPSILFLPLLSFTFVSCHVFPAERTIREVMKQAEWGKVQSPRIQDRQQRSVSSLKVLDFSADNDQQPDTDGEYTGATLEAGPLPESFTICSAMMVEAWTTIHSGGFVFTLRSNDSAWAYIIVQPSVGGTSTEYSVRVGPWSHLKQTTYGFFPLQWTLVCLSVDTSNLKMVVDGQLLVEGEYKRVEDTKRPANLSLYLGFWLDKYGYATELPVRITDLNVFKSSLSVAQMTARTTPGDESCGASWQAGDLVSWEEAEWILHSQAKVIEMDREWEGPCKRESQVQVFMADFNYHEDCMQHCQKISGGQSPPVTTKEEWETLTREIELITPDRSDMKSFWLSATEGDIGQTLAELDHWPEAELVNNKTKKLEAVETIWRDFYTGQRLDNWTKPYLYGSKDAWYDDNHNCMIAYPSRPWAMSWFEWSCYSSDDSCPCSYPVQPLLRLRGLCSPLIDSIFLPKQLPGNPGNMILLGQDHTRIEYNDTTSNWVLRDARYDVTAMSRATKMSYVLGKHKWTISNDTFKCNEGKPYTTQLKLSGCNPEGEFTCADGQCIKMEERCNQVPDCRDKSDERQCQIIVLEGGYNKNIPPIKRAKQGTAIPTIVSISITLMKVVEIEEVDHSIHLQFQISLSWKENRVRYQNLKKKTSLNALTENDIRAIWLPLMVYDNTDQKEVTRLGMEWEWATLVSVTRNLNNTFSRSGLDQVDEAEIFEGAEHNLTMEQMYTWEFQCKYQLQSYPFDTQVYDI